MKPNELMIGNWVSHKGKPIRIFEIDDGESNINTEQDGYCGIRCISIDEIKPIPLTPEILEKNGFELKPDGWLWCKEKENEEQNYIFIQFRKGLDEVRTVELSFVGKVQGAFRHIYEVHELQNLLKICGIQKEINETESESNNNN